MLTFLILSKPKTQDSKRKHYKNAPRNEKRWTCIGGRKTKGDTEELNSAKDTSVQPRNIGGVSILPTKNSESTLALVSKAESDYQKLKRCFLCLLDPHCDVFRHSSSSRRLIKEIEFSTAD